MRAGQHDVRVQEQHIYRVLRSRWTYMCVRVGGFALLAGYLFAAGDWRVSVAWAFALPLIALAVAWALVVSKMSYRVPRLNEHLLYPRNTQNDELNVSAEELDLKWVQFTEKKLPPRLIPFAAAEDGLICVPVLLVGISPVSAVIGGIAFGVLHLARFSYFECLGKALYYSLAIYVVLPHGVLTVAVGHIATDVFGLIVLHLVKRKVVANNAL